MHSKKILINASVLGEQLMGVGIYTSTVIEKLTVELEGAGIDYEIYSYPTPHLNFVKPGKINAIRLPGFIDRFLSKNRSMHRLFWNFFVLPGISKNFDLVYATSSYGCFKPKNQIITIHDLICLAFPSQSIMQYVYFKIFLPKIARNSTVIAISDFTKNEVIQKFSVRPQNISVIHNGADHILQSGEIVDDGLFLRLGLTKNRYFLTVGANLPHKNTLRLLDAAVRLKHTPYKFVVIGKEGPYLEKIKRKIEREDISNVILLNYVSKQELVLLYKNCTANIYISLYEGFGWPPIEAAIYNKLSIVSNTACLPEIYGNSVIYVKPYDSEDIYKKIEIFINSGMDVNDYYPKLPPLVEKYKWAVTIKNIYNVIKAAL